MDNLPNEIVLQILSYLNLGELIQCARVSNRLRTICKDKSLSYGSNMLAMKDLTVNDRKSIIDYLIAGPETREVNISWIYCPEVPYKVKSLTSEEIPSATQFFKRAYKISHFPGL